MDNWIKAGKIAAQVLDFGKKLIKKDESLLNVTEKVEIRINELDAEPAFPVNISINEIAAHYSAFPEDKVIFKEGDLVKLDVGVSVNGAIGDCACSIDLGNNKDLIRASEEALNNAIKIVKKGIEVCDIGKEINNVISRYNLKPIRNLSGHGLEKYNVHTGITIPNYDNGDKMKLKNLCFAIEPFATDGAGLVVEGKNSGIYKIIAKKNIRSSSARKVLEYIDKNFRTLPFSKRWINMPFRDISLNLLEREGILYQYPQLVEKNKGLVSQAEHSLRVNDKVEVLTEI